MRGKRSERLYISVTWGCANGACTTEDTHRGRRYITLYLLQRIMISALKRPI